VAKQVVATDAALAAIESLTAKHGPLMLVQSGGCCDGSSPICLHAGELLTGPNDLLLGTPGGAAFYIDAEQYERWNRPQLVLDAAAGAAEGFSLEGLEGVHSSRARERARQLSIRENADDRSVSVPMP
jgi:uncharacterized protein